MSMYMNRKMRLAISIGLSLLFIFSLAHASSPADETPTDRSIWIKIDEANFSMSPSDDMVKITIMVKGRASPDIDHCGIAFITIYKNGTTDYNGAFLKGPIEINDGEKLVFVPINGTWQNWKFYHVAYVDKNKLGLKEGELKNISSFEIWVRGYKDKNETLWNQTHATLTEVVKKEIESIYKEPDDEKQSHIIFGIMAVAIAAIIIAIAYKKFK